MAKSLYVISNFNAWNPPVPVQSYLINADGTLTYQKTCQVPNVINPQGLAIDTHSNTLFMTVQGSGDLQIIDSLTMSSLGSVTANGKVTNPTSLYGIVMDEKNNLLYTVDQGTANLYVYQWDRPSLTLTSVGNLPIVLATPSAQGSAPTACGIALDTVNDRLYVTTGSFLYVYKTSDWSLAKVPGHPDAGMIFLPSGYCPTSVAIDSARQLVYLGGGYDHFLQYNLAASEATAEKKVTVPNPNSNATQSSTDYGWPSGLAVDNATGDVYVSVAHNTTPGDCGDLVAYNNPSSLTQIQTISDPGLQLLAPYAMAIPSSGSGSSGIGRWWPPYRLLMPLPGWFSKWLSQHFK
jgi:DNA-binding beta-propeller fold protein YncE